MGFSFLTALSYDFRQSCDEIMLLQDETLSFFFCFVIFIIISFLIFIIIIINTVWLLFIFVHDSFFFFFSFFFLGSFRFILFKLYKKSLLFTSIKIYK